MWEDQIFEKGQVKVSAVLWELDLVVYRAIPVDEETKFHWLVWSIERL